jgi:hypothetical protein
LSNGEEGASRRGPATSQFHETESTNDEDEEEEGSRNAPRRELVQVVLRDTMRKHGIPSDWIECRILSTVNRAGRPGLHVSFVVRDAHERLLGYVFAFQDSFEKELVRFDARARDWVLGIGWEFVEHNLGGVTMPDPLSWTRQQPPAKHAPLARPGSRAPLKAADDDFAPTADAAALEAAKSEEEIQRDLQALFAIRDAALAATSAPVKPAKAARRERPDGPDFEPTQPSSDSGPKA